MNYPSRLLQNLDRQLGDCADPASRARLISRRAIHFARLNQLDKANAEIDQLRGWLGSTMDPTSGTWILLAEGVIAYFGLDLDRSFDRLRRAHGIAKAARVQSALAASGAWLAHVTNQRAEYDQAISNLCDALEVASEHDNFARCRCSLVAADICGFANLPELARRWHHFARLQATAEGDEASLAAMLFNVTAFRVNEARLADALGEPIPQDFHQIVKEIESSIRFDQFTESAGLPSAPTVLKGHALVVQGEFSAASELLGSVLAETVYKFNRAAVASDLAYTYAHLGQQDLATAMLGRANDDLPSVIDDDDLAFSLARLAAVHSICGDGVQAASLLRRARESFERFRSVQESVRELVRRIPDPDLVWKK